MRELGSGRSRIETAQELGIRFQITPNLPVDDGIHAVRMLLPRCFFDEKRTAPGVEALRHYHKRYNRTLKEFSGTPVHDWASHPADGFRGLAVRHQTPKDKKAEPKYRRLHSMGGTGWSWR